MTTYAAILGPDGQPSCVARDVAKAAEHVRACTDPNCESFAHEVVVATDWQAGTLAEARRLLAIESAAHALLDAIGPSGDMPEKMRKAAEKLAVACVRSK